MLQGKHGRKSSVENMMAEAASNLQGGARAGCRVYGKHFPSQRSVILRQQDFYACTALDSKGKRRVKPGSWCIPLTDLKRTDFSPEDFVGEDCC